MSGSRGSHATRLLVLGILAGTVSSADLVPSEPFGLVLSLSKTVWQQDERVKATLVFENNTGSAVTIVRPWLPSGWKVRRRYSLDGEQRHEERLGGILRGVTGEFHSARRQRAEYITVESHDSLKVEVDLTSWLRNQGDEIPEGEYRVSLWYRYERSREEAALPLLDKPIFSNEVVLWIDLTPENWSNRTCTEGIEYARRGAGMKRNRFTEEQIIGAVKEHESGAGRVSQGVVSTIHMGVPPPAALAQFITGDSIT